MTRKGIDVSHWQHPRDAAIDWPAVRRAGISWAAIKLTEGHNFVDPWAERDLHGAKAAGLETVLYHFARPLLSTATTQADYFLRNVALVGGADLAAVDVEDGRHMGWGALASWVNDYLNRGAAQLLYYDLEYRRAMRPMLHLGFTREWVAAPSNHQAPAACAVWQRGQASVPGVPARVDVDDVLYEAGRWQVKG